MNTLLSLILGPNTGWALSSQEEIIQNGIEIFKPRIIDTATGRYERFYLWLDKIKEQNPQINQILIGDKKTHEDPEMAHIYRLFQNKFYQWFLDNNINYKTYKIQDARDFVTQPHQEAKEYTFISYIRQNEYKPKKIYDADAIALILLHQHENKT